MSQLAKKIAKSPTPAPSPTPRGPQNKCFPLYGAGDVEDLEQVENLRANHSWREVQEHVDHLLGIESPLTLDKFRRHWRRRCYCWPEGLRL